MPLNEYDLGQITERLVEDFHDLIPFTEIIAVLLACAAENPASPPELVEQATRIHLQIRRQAHNASG